MSLSLSTAEKSTQTKSEELLDAYLKGACKFMDNMEKGVVSKAAKNFLKAEDKEFNEYYGKPLTKELLSKVSEDDIAKKETELKAQAKAAPFKAKANYALNAEMQKDNYFSVMAPTVAALPGLAVLVNAAEQGSLEGVAVGLAGVGAAVGAAAAVYKIKGSLEAKNPEEQKAIDNYIDVKHSLVALKQLKKAIQKENGTTNLQLGQKFLAAGYGNPGGMITVPAFAKRKEGGR